jgi:hypothetical protein
MTTYSTITETGEGQADITTKSKWLYVFPMPHTTVMPHPCSAADLKRLGTFIKWTTNDPAVLASLHESIVRLVQVVGTPGLVEIANSAKMTQRLCKTFPAAGSSFQEVVALAAQEGINFPLPPDVLSHLKGFQ